jgi:hypothetical protein
MRTLLRKNHFNGFSLSEIISPSMQEKRSHPWLWIHPGALKQKFVSFPFWLSRTYICELS